MALEESQGFREALRKIASDGAYRDKVIGEPKTILGDFSLNRADIEALRQAAYMSGADLTQVDLLFSVKGVSNYARNKPMFMDNGCCCCCCCCGDVGVEVLVEHI